MKRRLTAMLTAVMALALCLAVAPAAAFAADSTYTDSSTSMDTKWGNASSTGSVAVTSSYDNRTFNLYQVFTGTYDKATANLSSIDWGASVYTTDGTTTDLRSALVEKLKADATIGSKFTDADSTNAESVATAAASLTTDPEKNAFAKVVSGVLTASGSTAQYKTRANSDSKTVSGKDEYNFGPIATGYYLVDEKAPASDATAIQTYSAAMLRVAGPTSVEIKATVGPTVDKKSKKSTDTSYEDTTTSVSIGDTIDYLVTGGVVDMSKYDSYTYTVTDTMSKGLTFDASSVSAYIAASADAADADKTSLTKDTHYTVTTESQNDGSTKVTITFTNMKQWTSLAGQSVYIKYSATLNENAVVGTGADTNKVELTYSNDPDSTTTNTTKPTDENNENYTSGIRIVKVGPDEATRLSGATFQVTGDNVNKVVTITDSFTRYIGTVYTSGGNSYTEENGGGSQLYYKKSTNEYVTTSSSSDVKAENVLYKSNGDGTYTEVAAEQTTGETYYKMTKDSDTKYVAVGEEGESAYSGYTIETKIYPYTMTRTSKTVDTKTGAATTATATSGENGIILFEGLGAGTYKVKETNPPAGYKIDSSEHTVVISLSSATGGVPTWSFTVDSDTQTPESDGLARLTVENGQGSNLPTTGGIGTTIFYIIGGVLVVGTTITLIVKRRMRGAQR